jgi:hypothetical protein
MKITEIILEDTESGYDNKVTLPDNHVDSVSDMKKFPKLQSSDPYNAWIFAKGIGGAHGSDPKKDFEAGFTKEGPVGQSLTVAPYTTEEDRMIEVTRKKMGTPEVQITAKGSKEGDDVHKESPYHRPGPIKLNRK